jgi:hypothetical protein
MTERENEDFWRSGGQRARKLTPTRPRLRGGTRKPSIPTASMISRRRSQVGREYFARAPGSEIWVSFDDLPNEARAALWEAHKRELGFYVSNQLR